MADATPVDVLNSRHYLLKESTSLRLLQFLALDDVIKQLSATGILHDEEKLARGFDNLRKRGKISQFHLLVWQEWLIVQINGQSGRMNTYLVELNHVWMSDFLENVDLSRHPLHIALVLDSVLLQNLDCDLFTSYCMRANSYFAKCSRSERSS